jgi:PAS domain-containing protein
MSNVFAKSNSKTAKPIHLIGTGILQKEQNLIHKLELSVEKFSSIFSSANDAIIIIDSSTGIITDCNSKVYELTELTLLNY